MNGKRLLLFILSLSLIAGVASAQQGSISLRIHDVAMMPVAHPHISVSGSSLISTTDTFGNSLVANISVGKYLVRIDAPGFETQVKTAEVMDGQVSVISFTLRPALSSLDEVVVQADAKGNTIGKLDLSLRPANSSQDLLKLVPGLFIAQHAGGGKAEQIFLRGFDVDHGTDFAILVDGMPVNMPSHAHGQGYADLHFLIPETVRELEVNKGPYATKYGDMATSGSGEFKTFNALDRNQVKLEYGSFNTQRALAMLNVLDKKHLFSKKKENIYVAGEYKFMDSYFASKQDFTRVNMLVKYNGLLKNGAQLNITLSTFRSNWNASGQIPQRSVADGTISRFGSVDPTEGGQTSRSNVNLVYTKPIENGLLKTQVYFSRYDFNLYSNFTFFLKDSVHGDQIKQVDHRNITGYANTLQLNHKLGSHDLATTYGAGLRYDNSEISLLHTMKRTFLNDIVSGTLNQVNAWLYADAQLGITSKLKLNVGSRLDFYRFGFSNHTFDTASGEVMKALLSPKLSLIYAPNDRVQLFARSGYGFHSNDARAVVIGKLQNTLPRALGYEVGSTFKAGKKWLVNVAVWGLDLESELVYVGDAAIVEAAGSSRRLGVDLGVRYQVAKYLFIDADVNVNNGVLLDEPANASHIPLAPTFTSTGGITYKKSTGFNGSFRYRYMGDRAATEDYSLVAMGYFLADVVVNYNYTNYQAGITVENLFNTQWKEAQFATESRLKNEAVPMKEIHFTPGTPRFIKVSVSYLF